MFYCIDLQKFIHSCPRGGTFILVSIFSLEIMLRKSLQIYISALMLLLLLLSRVSRVQLCDPRDSSPPGSSVPGTLQARTLEWVAISFSNAWKWKVKVKSLSPVWLSVTPWTAAYQAPPSMEFSRQEYWSGVPLPSPLRTLSAVYLSIYILPN